MNAGEESFCKLLFREQTRRFQHNTSTRLTKICDYSSTRFLRIPGCITTSVRFTQMKWLSSTEFLQAARL